MKIHINVDVILIFLDSLPYQDLDHGALTGEGSPNMGPPQLDDDDQFPPMTHKASD